MATILPHTTRATGTVLTAAIYNTDHQNHIANANSLNVELSAVSGVGAASGIIVSNGAGVISGRAVEAGANISVTNGNGLAGNPIINLATALSGLTGISMTLADDGAAGGPDITIVRTSVNPAVGDVLGRILFQANDTAGGVDTYAMMQAVATDPTSASEDGTFEIWVAKAGTLAKSMSFTTNSLTLTAANSIPVINNSVDNGITILMGGSTANTGGQVFCYGNAHATAAADIAFFTENVQRYRYDHSADTHFTQGFAKFGRTGGALVHVGDFSLTGATVGLELSASSQRLSISANVTASVFVGAWYNPNGIVGSISIAGTGTAYNITSDERVKNFLGVYNPEEAIRIIRADPVRDFTMNGEYAVGWGAQTSYAVSKDLATPGIGDPGDDDFMPWGVDQGKRTPYLWAAVTNILDRLEALEAA